MIGKVMKAREAINILKMFSPDTEVELIFPDAHEVKAVRKPVKPLTEGQMASLPMNPNQSGLNSGCTGLERF